MTGGLEMVRNNLRWGLQMVEHNNREVIGVRGGLVIHEAVKNFSNLNKKIKKTQTTQ